MHVSKSRLLRCGIMAAAVLLVGWGMWRCQSHDRLLDSQTFYPSDYVHTWEYGWPMFHTHEIKSGDVFVPTSAQYDRTALFPGILVDASVWCLVLVATGCVAWRWTAHGRQWRLRTLFGVSVVVAILLGWWRWEYNAVVKALSPRYVALYVATCSDAPMLVLLQSPWYVCVPVLFGLGCSIYWIGWIGGAIVTRITNVIHHAAMSKLR